MVGSKEYLLYQKFATEPIDHKFEVPSHLVTDKSVAKNGDQTQHLFIQQQYVYTLSKIEAVKQQSVEYDMIDIAIVPVGVHDSSGVHVADMFQYDNAHILTAWNTISWKTACTYQWAINTAMSDEDQVSSKWLEMLLYESCTTKMKEVLMLEYGNLDVCFCGGVTFAWMLCNKLFGLNWDTTVALVNFSKLFWNKGLRCYQGKNVALAQKEILDVCSRLAEAKELLQETPVDLLTGLTLCSVDQFKTLFGHKLQVAKVESLEGNHHLSQPEIMREVRILLASAAQYYSSFNMNDTWNLPQNQRLNVFDAALGAKNSCWNCGKPDHSLDHCTQPRNEKRIAENRCKWMEANGQNPKKKGKGGSGNYGQESGVLLSQESRVFIMSMGLPTPTVERSIMGLIVVGTQLIPQSFTRNGQQKALLLTLLWNAHLMNWS